jgi:hypothetical protein
MGLIDVGIRGISAYRNGDYIDQEFFRQLPTRDPAGALKNADTLTSFVLP